jgi:Zn-dependent metalloprotease
MLHRHHPLHCIIPPVVLDQIARNGNARQRARALETMSVDQSLRAARLQNLAQKAAARRRADTLALPMGGQPRRTIYSAGNGEDLPGTIVRAEGASATGDPAVDEAYDGLGATYDLFWDVYERNSIDDEGLPLDGIVHYGKNYDNAFWDGRRMIFGDGDGELFNRFTIAVDVIGHELSHGLTEDEAQLYYWQQPGALNESVSDVYGSLVKQSILKQTADKADWLIGAGLLTSKVKGMALRSMAAPGTAYDDPVLGKDPQPGHMRDYVQTVSDNGGVHINSGIPNHAFYQVATKLGGYAWERAGRIWYETLRDPRLRPTAQFRTFARITLTNARRLYGDGSDEQAAVKEGWAKVGISV